MSRNQPNRMRALLLGLSLSACAFGVIAYRARADHMSAVPSPHGGGPGRGLIAYNVHSWPSEPKRNGADLVAPPIAPKHGSVVVPSFAGKRVSKARREARALGLKLVAFDVAGERIRGELGPVYRIDSQQVAAGERVPPGAPITVRAHEVEPIAVGY